MTSIDERLAATERRLATVESILESLRPVDLSDKYADFTVRRSPPQWLSSGGEDYTGQPISTTTPEFCEAIASFLDWTAQKDEEKNHSYVNNAGKTVFPAPYARKDAARARAWAAKLRAAPRRTAVTASSHRRQAPATPAQPSFPSEYEDGNDEIPF